MSGLMLLARAAEQRRYASRSLMANKISAIA